MNISIDDQDTPAAAAATIGSYRDALPTHFTFKIQSFSVFTTFYPMEKFESNEFEAGSYKWRLVFYPKGNNTTTSNSTSTTLQNGTNGSPPPHHVSMFLKIVSTNSLPRGWVLDASFRFFVLDQIRDKYLILGDMGGKTRRFHGMKTMWGYDQLISLTTLSDSSNGYLVDDTCVFGAEVLPCKSTGCGDCLTMIRTPPSIKYTWKLENFSKVVKEHVFSDVFIVADEYKWRIQVYPKGHHNANKANLSLHLCMDGSATDTLDAAAAAGYQVYARYRLRVRDQVHNNHKETHVVCAWFKIFPYGFWGFSKFLRLDELNNQSKGYLVNDTIIVEAEVTVLGVLKNLS